MTKPKPAPRSPQAKDLRTPKYRSRIVRDRTKYTRKTKHRRQP